MTHTHAERHRAIVALLALLLALAMVTVAAPPVEAAPDPIESYSVNINNSTCDIDASVTLSQKGKQAFDVALLILNDPAGTTVTARSLFPNVFPAKGSTVEFEIPGSSLVPGTPYEWLLRVTRNRGNWNDGDPTNGFEEFTASTRSNPFVCGL